MSGLKSSSIPSRRAAESSQEASRPSLVPRFCAVCTSLLSVVDMPMDLYTAGAKQCLVGAGSTTDDAGRGRLDGLLDLCAAARTVPIATAATGWAIERS